jgi:predicted hydrocarbon binding protein/predicted amino acid-binding ACT domain protein
MAKKTLPKVIPKRLFSLEETLPGEKLYEVCVLLKDKPGALAKAAQALADAGVNIKAESSFYVPNYDGMCFWTAFLDLSKTALNIDALKKNLLELDVIEDARIEEPIPVPFEVMHFPALHANTRAMIMTIGSYWALMSRLEKILTPSGMTALHYDAGKSVGEHMAVRLTEIYHLDVDALIKAFAQAEKAIGWGVMEFRQIDFKRRSGTVVVRNGFEAEAWGKKNYKVCDVTRGVIAGFMSIVFSKPVEVKETKCLANGSKYCEFVIQSEL